MGRIRIDVVKSQLDARFIESQIESYGWYDAQALGVFSHRVIVVPETTTRIEAATIRALVKLGIACRSNIINQLLHVHEQRAIRT